jgi:hypothetical protein
VHGCRSDLRPSGMRKANRSTWRTTSAHRSRPMWRHPRREPVHARRDAWCPSMRPCSPAACRLSRRCPIRGAVLAMMAGARPSDLDPAACRNLLRRKRCPRGRARDERSGQRVRARAYDVPRAAVPVAPPRVSRQLPVGCGSAVFRTLSGARYQ